MKKVFSIIVPVYNAEKHLRKCLDSIIAQTFKDFEVILIDDGSRDLSGTICDEYGERDARFHIFHQKNQGVGVARAIGLKMATGDYLVWIDADDYAELDLLNMVHEKLSATQADIINIGHKAIYNRKSKVIIPSAEWTLDKWRESTLLGHRATLWSYVSRRSLWNGIHVPAEVERSGEDGYLTLELFFKAKVITAVERVLYNHLIDTAGSIRHTNNGKIFLGNYYIWKCRLTKCRKYGYNTRYADYCASRAFSGAVKAYSMSLITEDLTKPIRGQLKKDILSLKKYHISGRLRDKFLAFCIQLGITQPCRWYAVHKIKKAKQKNREIIVG